MVVVSCEAFDELILVFPYSLYKVGYADVQHAILSAREHLNVEVLCHIKRFLLA